MAFQQNYPLVVTCDGYDRPEVIELKILGKLNNGGIYQSTHGVTLRGSGMHRINFDVRK
jgi:hypothetical protein